MALSLAAELFGHFSSFENDEEYAKEVAAPVSNAELSYC